MFPTRKITTSGGDVFRDEFSLAFDGTNDYIDLSGTFNYNVHSISIWLKETATSGQSTIFDHRDGNNDGINFYLASGQPLYAVNNVDAHYTTSLDLNQWSHIVLTNDGSTSTIYVNGVSVKTADTSGETINISSSANARFARDNTGNYFTGNLSEAAIYDKALSASEVKTLYNSREPYNHKEGVCSSNLQGWWRMGDGVLDDFNLIADQTNATKQNDLMTIDYDTQFTEKNTDSNNTVTYPTATSVRITTTDGAAVGIEDANLLTTDSVYNCIIDITVHSGVGGRMQGNTTVHQSMATTGIYNFSFIAGDPKFNIFRRTASATDFTINSIIIQEVNGNAGVMTNMDTDDFEGDTP